MKTLNILDWKVECDPEATTKAHSAMKASAPEMCGCVYCKNFMEARHLAYPDEARKIFSELGIIYTRESEIGVPVELSPNNLLYTGWFHFVGKILEGPTPHKFISKVETEDKILDGKVYAMEYLNLTGKFQMGLIEKRYLIPAEFGETPVVQLEFSVEIPWVFKGLPDFAI